MSKVLCQLSLIIVVIKANFVKCSKTLFTLDNFSMSDVENVQREGAEKVHLTLNLFL